MTPAIVVAAYDRPNSLRRLLSSLANLECNGLPRNIPLVISLDGGHPGDVYQIAHDFHWAHGEKIIQAHSAHLGLKDHIVSCGDLTANFDSIILLEDDLFVSPYFYQYAKEAEEFYANDSSIAGIALYSQYVNETASQSFCPIHDGSDARHSSESCRKARLSLDKPLKHSA
jgi:hypothetical protein